MSMTPEDLARRSVLRQAVILNSLSAGSLPLFLLQQPTISALVPDTMVDGSGNVTVTVTGTNFRDGATCVINGQPGQLPATVVNPTTLTTVVNTNVLHAGDYTMYVKEGPVDSHSLPFTITPGVPRTITVAVIDDVGGSHLIVAQVSTNQPGPLTGGEVEWGDGSANSPMPTIPAQIQHTYAVDGTFSVRAMDRTGPVSNIVAVTVPHAVPDPEVTDAPTPLPAKGGGAGKRKRATDE